LAEIEAQIGFEATGPPVEVARVQGHSASTDDSDSCSSSGVEAAAALAAALDMQAAIAAAGTAQSSRKGDADFDAAAGSSSATSLPTTVLRAMPSAPGTGAGANASLVAAHAEANARLFDLLSLHGSGAAEQRGGRTAPAPPAPWSPSVSETDASRVPLAPTEAALSLLAGAGGTVAGDEQVQAATASSSTSLPSTILACGAAAASGKPCPGATISGAHAGSGSSEVSLPTTVLRCAAAGPTASDTSSSLRTPSSIAPRSATGPPGGLGTIEEEDARPSTSDSGRPATGPAPGSRGSPVPPSGGGGALHNWLHGRGAADGGGGATASSLSSRASTESGSFSDIMGCLICQIDATLASLAASTAATGDAIDDGGGAGAAPRLLPSTSAAAAARAAEYAARRAAVAASAAASIAGNSGLAGPPGSPGAGSDDSGISDSSTGSSTGGFGSSLSESAGGLKRPVQSSGDAEAKLLRALQLGAGDDSPGAATTATSSSQGSRSSDARPGGASSGSGPGPSTRQAHDPLQQPATEARARDGRRRRPPGQHQRREPAAPASELSSLLSSILSEDPDLPRLRLGAAG
jgi:hypothetical protein